MGLLALPLARLQLLGAPLQDLCAEAPRHECQAGSGQQHVEAHRDAQGGLHRQVAPGVGNTESVAILACIQAADAHGLLPAFSASQLSIMSHSIVWVYFQDKLLDLNVTPGSDS